MADNAIRQRLIRYERRINMNLDVAREQLRLIDAKLVELREAYDNAVAANQAGLVLPDSTPVRVPSRVEIDRLEERRRTYDEVRRMLESILAEPDQGIRYPPVTRSTRGMLVR